MKSPSAEYDDNCPACRRTYATLRIYPGETCPDTVTAKLAKEPTKSWHRERDNKPKHGWFLTTRGEVSSLDCRRHIDWLLAHLEGKETVVQQLQAQGASVDIICFWHTSGEQGGPQLSQAQLQKLAALNIDIAWNIYTGK